MAVVERLAQGTPGRDIGWTQFSGRSGDDSTGSCVKAVAAIALQVTTRDGCAAHEVRNEMY
jgi:hypothetical protein